MGVTLAADLNPQVVLAEAFEQHFEAVRRFAYGRSTASPGLRADLADEIASETFARAVQLWPRFDPSAGTLRAWLFGIAANVTRERDRAGRRYLTAVGRVVALRDPDGRAGSAASGIEDHELVVGLLSKIQPPVREVLLLVAGLGLSYEEAGVALGIPEGTVASRLSTGRRQLARLLAATQDTTGPGRRSG
jgi:RNA polymerase sigma factor (sigma-70 family)